MGRRFLQGASWRVSLGATVSGQCGNKMRIETSNIPRGRTERVMVLEAIVGISGSNDKEGKLCRSKYTQYG